jgi:hypothetical protein
MKVLIIIAISLLVLFVLLQFYVMMLTNKTESQSYEVILTEKEFEVRYYPSSVMAKIFSTSKSYRDLGSSGFGKLAGYIFGGNHENKQIAMTSPVHMDIGDTISTMSFVMPSSFKKDDLPKPNNSEVQLQIMEPEYVAVIQFGGFANTSNINKYKTELKQLLDKRGISYFGNFRLLGYNPPYQLFGRRNEIIVSLNPNEFSHDFSINKAN